MTVTFLGTSSGGGPTETRSCSSLVVDVEGRGDKTNNLWSTRPFPGIQRPLHVSLPCSGRLRRGYPKTVYSNTEGNTELKAPDDKQAICYSYALYVQPLLCTPTIHAISKSTTLWESYHFSLKSCEQDLQTKSTLQPSPYARSSYPSAHL